MKPAKVGANVLDSVTTGDQVVIERYNKPVAALISYADFLALHEELEDLRAARRAEAAYAAWQEDPARAPRGKILRRS